ncbi:Hsp70 family protein [Dactylosporangium sp. CA-092794]|uniref:Hsp70 family protein n=1 Tax=Dactylosporangium sp. CA-092794 TaxID=3239929 RepID=UPI003D92B45D
MAAGPRLGIDFGTSHTVALLAWPDGRVRPLLFDGSPLLPSAVYAQIDGGLLVGRDALHAARVDPSRFEGSPKRRIDDGTVLLGDRELSVPSLIGAVLGHVAQEATRVAGGPVAELTLTHPAAWGVSRRLALIEGAKLAGLPQPALMPEPVAAAHYFAGVLQKPLTGDQGLLVYDFGGGTFDASLVSRAGDGFDVRAVDGIDDLGGLDLDALVVDHARQQITDADVWTRLDNPQSTEDRRHRRMLWDDARIAKEMLSRSQTAALHVPIAAADVSITREAFEEKARPMLDQTVRTTAAVMRWANLDKERLAGLFLVGGSSRVPLVSTLLQRELGLAPTVIEQPELVVAEGSLRAWVNVSPAQNAGAPAGQIAQAPPNAAAGGPGAFTTPAAASGLAAAAGGAAAGGPGAFGTPAAAAGTPGAFSAPAAAAPGAFPAGAGAPGAFPATGQPPQNAAPQNAPAAFQQPQPPQHPQNPQQPPQNPQQAVPQAPVSGVPVSPAAFQPGAYPVSAPPGTTRPVSATPVSPGAYPGAYPVSGPPQVAGGQATQPLRPTTPRPAYQQPPVYQQPQAPPPQAYVSPAAMPATYAPPPREDPVEPPRQRRSIAVPLLVGILVLALALAGYVVFQNRDHGGTDQQNAAGSPTPAGSASSAVTQLPQYSRESVPSWVPSGWKEQPVGSIDQLWISREESEGGRCDANRDRLRVTTNALTGCTLKAPLDVPMQDGSIEAKVHVTSGCGGLWLRTGDRGYMLGLCADNHARLYKLSNRPPGQENLLKDWLFKPAGDDTYVAFEIQGADLTVYLNGKQLGPVTDADIRSGKITLGAFTLAGDNTEAVFSQVRVIMPGDWQPGTQQQPTKTKQPTQTPSPTSSGWWSNTPSAAPTSRRATPLPTA